MTPISRLSGRALAGLLPDLRALPGPVYVALADAAVALVLDGRIAPDTRLPSERELAEHLGLSRATVTAGYDELRARGFLRSRTGAGSFVSLPPDVRPSTSFTRWTRTGPGVDEIDVSCSALPAPPGVLAAALAEAAERLPVVAATDGYDPMGLAALRAAVADRFTARGVATAADQILITNGSLHAFDLVLRLLVGPGDRVLTELPTYPGALDALRANGARIVPVPVGSGGGWDVGQLRATLRQTSPRLAYLIPDFHNPTGALVGTAERRDVLRAARDTGTTVVVDESYVELGYGVAPDRPTAALDSSVLTVGSLSKPVWGGVRLGWVRGPSDLIRRLAVLRAGIDMTGSALDQLVGTALFPRLDEIVAARRAELQPRRDALLAGLAGQLPHWRVRPPEGGLSVWVELDAPLATPLTLAAAQLGVQIVPGSRFGVDGTLERFLRLTFAEPVERLDEAVRRLAAAWAELDRTGPPLRQLVVA